MSLALEVFASDSPLIEAVWRSSSERPVAFTSQAISHWEIVVWRHEGRSHVSVRGPETRATPAVSHEDAEYVGVQFRLGTFMPCLPTVERVNGEVRLAGSGSRSVWLDDRAWEVPAVELDDVEAFVERLARRGLFRHDPLVQDLLQGAVGERSSRTVRRRFVNAIGHSPRTFGQIERARRAFDLLEQGTDIADVVFMSGYADQPHLTRSLARFMGSTPGVLRRSVVSLEGPRGRGMTV